MFGTSPCLSPGPRETSDGGGQTSSWQPTTNPLEPASFKASTHRLVKQRRRPMAHWQQIEWQRIQIENWAQRAPLAMAALVSQANRAGGPLAHIGEQALYTRKIPFKPLYNVHGYDQVFPSERRKFEPAQAEMLERLIASDGASSTASHYADIVVDHPELWPDLVGVAASTIQRRLPNLLGGRSQPPSSTPRGASMSSLERHNVRPSQEHATPSTIIDPVKKTYRTVSDEENRLLSQLFGLHERAPYVTPRPNAHFYMSALGKLTGGKSLDIQEYSIWRRIHAYRRAHSTHPARRPPPVQIDAASSVAAPLRAESRDLPSEVDDLFRRPIEHGLDLKAAGVPGGQALDDFDFGPDIDIDIDIDLSPGFDLDLDFAFESGSDRIKPPATDHEASPEAFDFDWH